jgi:2-phospho-L-lactate guanylyltransferase
MRGIARGKSRLAEALDPIERARLNRRLLGRTLSVIATWQGHLSRCIVISGCVQALQIAVQAGAVPLIEPRPSRGLNHAVSHAARRAIRSGARAIVVLPSDLPRLSGNSLDALFGCATYGIKGVIAPDAEHSGTNALLLKTRGRFAFSFGLESCARHVELVCLRGWRFAICAHPDLALDIDLPRDLLAARAMV